MKRRITLRHLLRLLRSSSPDLVLGGGSTTLAGLTDVVVASMADNDLLAYDLASATWKNQTAAQAGLSAVGHVHAAADITSGTMATARLGSGTADATKFLRGDQTWAVPAGSSSTWGVVLPPASYNAPTTTAAALLAVAGGSTPAETLDFLAFDAAAVEYADFLFRLPTSYAGGGITIKVYHSVASGTGGVVIAAAIRKLEAAVDDVSAAHTYVFGGDNVMATDGLKWTVNALAPLTSGAAMDNLLAGEAAILRIKRVATDASDTLAADWRLHMVTIQET